MTSTSASGRAWPMGSPGTCLPTSRDTLRLSARQWTWRSGTTPSFGQALISCLKNWGTSRACDSKYQTRGSRTIRGTSSAISRL